MTLPYKGRKGRPDQLHLQTLHRFDSLRLPVNTHRTRPANPFTRQPHPRTVRRLAKTMSRYASVDNSDCRHIGHTLDLGSAHKAADRAAEEASWLVSLEIWRTTIAPIELGKRTKIAQRLLSSE